MSRPLLILIVLIAILASFFVFKNVKNSNDNLPVGIHPIPSTTVPTAQGAGFEFEKWHEFTAPDGNFQVLLPSLPQHATDKIQDQKTKELRKFDMFVSTKNDGTVFMISMITFPSKIDEKAYDEVLANIVNDMLTKNKDNKLRMKEINNFHDIKALDFAIDNNGITIGGKAFIRQNTLYVLSMIVQGDNFNKQEFDFFVNSFDIKK